MAGKTLIGGTAYDISGGKTLVNGTSYSIAGGKTLVGGTAYDISFLLSPGALDIWTGSSRVNINCIAYANGYWVVGGQYWDGSIYHCCIAYSTSLNGTWTTTDLWSNTSTGRSNYINCITYANGYWIVGGQYDTRHARIAYATSPDGTWTTKDLWYALSTSYSNFINCITYANGYWVVGGRYYAGGTYYAQIAYATDPTGTWTEKLIWSGSTSHINCITYANGYWVVGGQFRDGIGNYNARIAYVTDLTGNWIANSLWSSSNSRTDISGVTYANGYWAVCGWYYDGSSTYYTRIAYTTSPASTWTTKDMWSSTSSNIRIRCITYANDHWVVGGSHYDGSTHHARLAHTTSLDDTWAIKDLWDHSGYASQYITIECIIYADGYWAVGGFDRDDSNYYARIAYSPSLEGFDEI